MTKIKDLVKEAEASAKGYPNPKTLVIWVLLSEAEFLINGATDNCYNRLSQANRLLREAQRRLSKQVAISGFKRVTQAQTVPSESP